LHERLATRGVAENLLDLEILAGDLDLDNYGKKSWHPPKYLSLLNNTSVKRVFTTQNLYL
jgi:hypothetical protein